LASISQDVPTDFDTDGFLSAIRVLEQKSNFKYDVDAFFTKKVDQLQINHDFKVIVDHIKANIFAIADGALPSNKDRGSVLRKLIRRAMVCAHRLKMENYIEPLVKIIVELNHEYYPYLVEQQSRILSVLKKEMASFSQTLDQGYKLFNETFKQSNIDIESIFKLVDTYGFPFELINELALEKGIKIDEDAYLSRLEKHKDISRAKLEKQGMERQQNELVNFNLDSKFDYDTLEIKNAKVIACFDENFHLIKQLSKKGWIVFDKTPFYATSGGQQHDNGIVKFNHQEFNVLDVIKTPNSQHLHLINIDKTIKVGDKANLLVDPTSRISLSRNHSSEHLIQHALQVVVDKSIKQEGAFKSPEKVTLDFQYSEKLTDKQLENVENEINGYIKLAVNVKTHHMTIDEAKQFGAIA
jgi:alanyl-tRNA synthetase